MARDPGVPNWHAAFGVASTTGDCSSRLQDSELDVLRVRVGVLEGALRDVDEWLDAAAVEISMRETGEAYQMLSAAHRAVRAVLAGGEAADPAKDYWGVGGKAINDAQVEQVLRERGEADE